jgi:hypothetical protein
MFLYENLPINFNDDIFNDISKLEDCEIFISNKKLILEAFNSSKKIVLNEKESKSLITGIKSYINDTTIKLAKYENSRSLTIRDGLKISSIMSVGIFLLYTAIKTSAFVSSSFFLSSALPLIAIVAAVVPLLAKVTEGNKDLQKKLILEKAKLESMLKSVNVRKNPKLHAQLSQLIASIELRITEVAPPTVIRVV